MKKHRIKKQIICVCMTLILVLILALPVLAEFIFIEAESGQNSGFAIVDGGALNGKAIEAATADDTIEYTFNIEKGGKYTIWARVWGVDSTMNSFLYSFNGDTFNDAMWIFDLYEEVGEISNADDPYYDPMVNTSELYESWYWMRVNYRDNSGDPAVWHNTRIFDMPAGTNTLVIKARELSSRIDKMIITDDFSYDPKTIAGDPEVPYLAALAAAEAEAAAAAAAAEQEQPAAAEGPTATVAAPKTSDSGVIISVAVFMAAFAALAAAKLPRKNRRI